MLTHCVYLFKKIFETIMFTAVSVLAVGHHFKVILGFKINGQYSKL